MRVVEYILKIRVIWMRVIKTNKLCKTYTNVAKNKIIKIYFKIKSERKIKKYSFRRKNIIYKNP